jgi:site-specific recombinase XerD
MYPELAEQTAPVNTFVYPKQKTECLMKTNTDFAKYISTFLSDYLPHHRNVSPNTIKSYTDTFIQFISFMRDRLHVPIERLTLDGLNRDNVTGFLQWIKDERKCSNATRNYRLAAICSFAHYLQYEDIGRLSRSEERRVGKEC